MARPLKFRAWNDGEMVTGVGLDPDCIPYKIPDGVESSDNFDYYPEAEIMQYTGITDRHGVEIYEGDIIEASLLGDGKSHGYKDEVQFRGKGIIDIEPVHLIVNFKDGNRDNFYIYEAILHRETEVIGNIYSNPELLDGNKE